MARYQFVIGLSAAAAVPVASTAVAGTLAKVGAYHAASAAAVGSPTAAEKKTFIGSFYTTVDPFGFPFR